MLVAPHIPSFQIQNMFPCLYLSNILSICLFLKNARAAAKALCGVSKRNAPAPTRECRRWCFVILQGMILTVTNLFCFVPHKIRSAAGHASLVRHTSSHRSGGSIPTKDTQASFSWITNKNGTAYAMLIFVFVILRGIGQESIVFIFARSLKTYRSRP